MKRTLAGPDQTARTEPRGPLAAVGNFFARHASQPADVSMQHAYVGLAAALVLSWAVFSFVYGSERADLLFSSREGKLIPLQYSSVPNTSSEAVVRWTAYAVGEVFTYNFNNVEDRILGAKRYFTKEGWDSFLDALSDAGTISSVKSARSFVTVVPSGIPVVSEEGAVEGVYTWVVQVPILTNVYTSSGNNSSATSIKVTIQEIPTRESSSGYAFGISRIVR